MVPLVLRDIHQPPSPPWWPPAPGWWLLLAGGAAIAVAVWWWRRRKATRGDRIAALFDAEVNAGDAPAVQLRAMSALLRRAARGIDPGADRLQGEAWADFLDAGKPAVVFGPDAARVLMEAMYRPDATAADADRVRAIARARFIEWMSR